MNTLILGLGKTGLSCARYLARRGDTLTVCDTRDAPPYLTILQQELPEVQIKLGPLDATVLATADRIVISPGLSIHDAIFDLAHEKNVPIWGDIELFAQQVTKPVIVITGSNGKSTVTSLVAAMAKAANINVLVAGNIGIPVCDLLGEPEADLYVLELSSFQLATTYSLKPLAATILNITPDHLDWHKNFDDYKQAKQRIYLGAKNKIYNRDDELTKTPHARFSFGLSEPEDETEFGLSAGSLMQGSQPLFAINDLKLIGQHNQLNALAALALGIAAGIPVSAMQQALREFTGLPHRCEWVAEHQGIQWYNDSKATNVGASISAITGLAPMIQGKIVLIAGGDAKGVSLQALQPVAAEHVRTAVVFGKDAAALAAVLDNHCQVIRVASLSEAVHVAAQQACSGDAVLLAPACSSLDMFVDYQQRGSQFKDEVLTICQKP